MSVFFIRSSDTDGKVVFIQGDDAFHIARSLRMAVGEEITVCDENRRQYRCVLQSIRDDAVTAEIRETYANDTEPPCRVRLYQSLAKGEKMDYIVQKAVELGVSAVIPVASARCILKLDTKTCSSKLSRWQKIADGAATQSGRGTKPRIASPLFFDAALRDAAVQCDFTLFCYEGDGTQSIRALLEKHLAGTPGAEDGIFTVGVFIGPEGGYEKEEFLRAAEAGMLPTALGKRILRCETASGFVLSCIVYHTEL